MLRRSKRDIIHTVLIMNLDPHTLQQILQRIRQQMRCPQCGGSVPVEFSSVQVVSEEAMILQLKCDGCNAYIVLHASLQGADTLGVKMKEEDGRSNASSTFQLSQKEMKALKGALDDFSGFEQIFNKSETSDRKTDIV